MSDLLDEEQLKRATQMLAEADDPDEDVEVEGDDEEMDVIKPSKENALKGARKDFEEESDDEEDDDVADDGDEDDETETADAEESDAQLELAQSLGFDSVDELKEELESRKASQSPPQNDPRAIEAAQYRQQLETITRLAQQDPDRLHETLPTILGVQGPESELDPDERLQRTIETLSNSVQAIQQREATDVAQRAIEDVLKGPKFEGYEELPTRARATIERELMQRLFEDPTATDGNAREKIAQWAAPEVRQWRRDLDMTRTSRLQKKAKAEKKAPPSSKGPKRAPKSRPKSKQALNFAEPGTFKKVRAQAEQFLREQLSME